jgi:D-sedoheptulose 7-phosphate isomerase
MSPRTNGNGESTLETRLGAQSRSDDLGALYPFLYSGTGDLDAVLAEVRRSTVDKIHQIVALRRQVLARDGRRIEACASAMAASFASGGRLFAIGNGGSCTDAADLASLFLHPGPGRRALPAFALTGDIAVLTALSNDVSFDVVFARQIAAFGRRNDVVVGLSTSGNSTNLVRAFDEASRRRLLTVGIAGYEGGAMAELDSIDHLFVVPAESVHRIQEAQTTIYHTLWELTLDELTTGRARSGTSRATPGRS